MSQTHSFESIRLSPKPNLPSHFSLEEEAIIDIKASPHVFQKILGEVLGTYIVMFAGCGSALVDREKTLSIIGIATVWALAVMAIVYALGHISGAHLNPAVSIAFGASRRLPWALVPVYVLSQLLGATLACLTLRALFSNQPDIKPAVTQYSDSLTDLQAVAFEFISTFILVFIVCGVATDDRASEGVAGIAVGATVWFIALAVGPVSGASLNPARSIAPAVVSGVYKNLWVYIVGPILGALAAVLVYSMLRFPEPHKSKDKTETISLEVNKTKTISNASYDDA